MDISINKSGLLNPELCHSGISYWNQEDGKKIKKLLNRYINREDRKNLYWDQVILDHLSYFRIKVIETEHIYEIDTPADLHSIRKLF